LLLLLVSLLAACGGKAEPIPATGALPEVSASGLDNSGRGLEVGQLAPDFVLTYPDGATSQLSDWQGQPVMINFWATWCAPCEAEMPEFVTVYQDLRDEGLVILAVNQQEEPEQAQTFIDRFKMEFPVALDSRGELMQLYQLRGLPTTIFIDREGRVFTRWAGILTEEQIRAYLAEIM